MSNVPLFGGGILLLLAGFMSRIGITKKPEEPQGQFQVVFGSTGQQSNVQNFPAELEVKQFFGFGAPDYRPPQNTQDPNDILLNKAMPLLNLIGQYEAQGSYDIVYGGDRLPITTWTIQEVIDWQINQRKRGAASTAVGKYQFIYKTFKGLVNTLNVSANARFDADLQDRFALELLKQRGFKRFVNNDLSLYGFMLSLSKEWASFPVPYNTRGHKRNVKAGETYYAGDGLNHALVSVNRVKATLERIA